MDPARLLRRLQGGSVANVDFRDMQRLMEALGFELRRVSGSHHIYAHADLDELVNLQEVRGQVKSYQVRQCLRLFERYALTLEA